MTLTYISMLLKSGRVRPTYWNPALRCRKTLRARQSVAKHLVRTSFLFRRTASMPYKRTRFSSIGNHSIFWMEGGCERSTCAGRADAPPGETGRRRMECSPASQSAGVYSGRLRRR